jgi:hypothetical protein
VIADGGLTPSGILSIERDLLVAASNLLVRIRAFPETVGGDDELLRGDSNSDGGVGLSDAVYTLNYLFLGGAPPVCRDAADSDDSGRLDISDPLRTVGYLFLDRPAPAQPHGACGRDPTPDDLACVRFDDCG